MLHGHTLPFIFFILAPRSRASSRTPRGSSSCANKAARGRTLVVHAPWMLIIAVRVAVEGGVRLRCCGCRQQLCPSALPASAAARFRESGKRNGVLQRCVTPRRPRARGETPRRRRRREARSTGCCCSRPLRPPRWGVFYTNDHCLGVESRSALLRERRCPLPTL